VYSDFFALILQKQVHLLTAPCLFCFLFFLGCIAVLAGLVSCEHSRLPIFTTTRKSSNSIHFTPSSVNGVMDVASDPLQVESAHATYTATPDSSSALPSSAAVNGSIKGDAQANGLVTNPNSNSNFNTASEIMSQQSSQPADSQEFDDAMAEYASPAKAAAATTNAAATTTTSTTTTSGRGRGRGRWTRTKNKVVKPPQPKAPTGRGRRHKVYDSLKAQAAHERAQELKQAFSAVVKLVKPAVQEIADRSINDLLEDPAALQEAPNHNVAQNFLRGRHQGALAKSNLQLQYGLDMTEHVYQAECKEVTQSFDVSHRPLYHDHPYHCICS
jgi:hypothetical protein